MRCYLVCYDIRHPRRLRRVHQVMKGYGEPWQYSVFFCRLRDIDRVRLESDLKKEMNSREDQTIIFDLGPDERKARENAHVIGLPFPRQDNSTVVI
ncbi:MAG: CRISPR-associated endonuclease Cas2 [Thermoleophilia bacterium]